MLQAEFNKYRSDGAQIDTPHSRTSTHSNGARDGDQTTAKHHQPQFVGPTRPAYAFNIARASLQGNSVPVDDPAFSCPPSPVPSIHDPEPSPMVCDSDPSCDKLRTMTKAEVIRLLTVYDEEVGPVYPIFDGPALISQTEAQFEAWLAAQDSMVDSSALDISLVRVAIAIAGTVDSMGVNDFSRQLVSSVEAEVSKTYASSVLTLRDAVLLTALVWFLFFFFSTKQSADTAADCLLLPCRPRALGLA